MRCHPPGAADVRAGLSTASSPASTAVTAATSDRLLLIGTMKGLFTLRTNGDHGDGCLEGPTFAGEEVYATCIDTRGDMPRLYAGSVSAHWGPVLRRSDDVGASWTEDETAALAFPDDTDAALARIWQV